MTKATKIPKTIGEKSAKPERRDIATRFQPGNKLGGRPKGSRNQLGEDFLSALQADFKAHGADVIETVRDTRPADYLKVVASILPKEVNVNKSALQELSDDELASILDAVRLQILSGVHGGAGDGSEKASRH